jgi:hypothetical protein
LFLLGFLLLLQAGWISLGLALQDGHETVQKLDFASGRDLLLRHLLPLFLAFSLLVPLESPVVIRMELVGTLLGWAGTNSLWGLPSHQVGAVMRRILSFLALAAGTYLLWKGWQAF